MQAALPLMVVGSLVQGFGGMKAAKSKRKAAKANSAAAALEGVAEEENIRHAARLAMGRQVGAQAESGFQIGTGTALQSLQESGLNAEMDVLNARRKTQSQVAEYRNQAKGAKMEGIMAGVGGLTGAASAIASHSSNYAQAKSAAGK